MILPAIGTPPEWFMEPLNKLVVNIHQNTMLRTGALRLCVTGDLGLRLGIAPGEAMTVATPAGYVEISSDNDCR